MKESERLVQILTVGFAICCLRPNLRLVRMTKYALHLKSSSGVIYFFLLPPTSYSLRLLTSGKLPIGPQSIASLGQGPEESSNPTSDCVRHEKHSKSRRSSRFTVGSTLTESAMMLEIPIRTGSRKTRAAIGPTNLRSSPCFRKSACLVSAYLLRVLAGHVVSLSDPPEDDDCDVAGLLDRLNDAMVAYRPGLRDYLKDALIPTVHHQTLLHDALRDQIDTSFATGVLSADQVCKNVESFRLKDEDDVTNIYSEVKVRIYPGLVSLAPLIPL